MLQFTGSQSVGHDLSTEEQQPEVWFAVNDYLRERYTYLLGIYYVLIPLYMLVTLISVLCMLYHMIHIFNEMKGYYSHCNIQNK